MKFCDAGPYNAGNVMVLTIGGGLTTDQMLYALRYLYFGGVFVFPGVDQAHFPAGDGPLRLVACQRHCFQQTRKGEIIPTVGEFLQKIKLTDLATWEVALRAFLANPFICFECESVLHIDDSTIDQGHVSVLVAHKGGEGPEIRKWRLDLNQPWPLDHHFFTSRPLDMVREKGNPFAP